MIDFLEKYSNKKNLFIGIALVVFINTIAFPYFPLLFPETPFSPKNFLDIRFGFTAETVQDTLSFMQEEGRYIYGLSTTIIDIPYAFIYGFVVSSLIVFLLKKRKTNLQPRKVQMLILMPFVITGFDLIENAGIIYFINSYPHINPHIIQLISISTQLKWTFAIITCFTVLTLLFMAYFRQKK